MAFDKVREAASRAIGSILNEGEYTSSVVNRFLSQELWPALDRSLFTEIVYGTVRFRYTIDFYIKKYSTRKFSKILVKIQNLLRTCIYQIFYLDKVPDHAAIDETVQIVKVKYGQNWANFCNALLRRVARERKKIFSEIDKNKEPEGLALKYSYTLWMVEYFIELFGDQVETALNWGNGNYYLTLRINFLQTTPAKLRRDLLGEGIRVEYGRYFPEAFIFDQGPPPFLTKIFQNGHFSIQDEASMMVSWAVNPQPDEVIIDLCAAPGGKATHMAELSADKAKIFAFDTDPQKINQINLNSQRLKLKSITTELAEAKSLLPKYLKTADKILVDAPCSGLGTINHRPDIKWNKRIKDVERLARLQLEILDSADKYLKKGGELIYSVCTFTREETTGVVKSFLEKNKNYQPLEIKKRLPEDFVFSKDSSTLQTIPHRDGIEGMFLAAFIKTDGQM